MSFGAPGSSGGLGKIPEYKASLLETVLKPLAVLDYPGNIVRSGILSISEADPSYLGEALTWSKTHSGGKLLKSLGISDDPGFWSSLGAEIVTDPLMLVGGLAGTPTKFGKALKTYGRAKTTLRAAQVGESVGLSTTKQVAEATSEVLKARKIVEKFTKDIPIGQRGAKRATVEAHIPFTKPRAEIGDFRKLKQSIAKYKVLPDSRIPWLERAKLSDTAARNKILDDIQLAKKEGKIKVLDKRQKSLAEVEKRLARTNQQLSELSTGVIPFAKYTTSPIEYSRTKIKRMRQRFKRKLPGVAEEAHQAGLRKTALFEHTTSLEKAVLDEQLASFKRMANETEQAFAERVLKAAEYRHQGGTFDAPRVLTETEHKAYKEIKDKYTRLLKPLLKTGWRGTKHPSDLNKTVRLQRAKRTVEVNVGDEFKKITDALNEESFKLKQKMEIKRAGIIGGQKAIRSFEPEELEVIFRLVDDAEARIPDLQKRHFNITKLQSSEGVLSYAPRIASKEAKTFKLKDKATYRMVFRELETSLASAKKRSLYPLMDIVSLNTELKKVYGFDFDFFDVNVADIFTKNKLSQVRAINKGATIDAIVAAYGKVGKIASDDIEAVELFRRLYKGKDLLDESTIPKLFIPKSLYKDATRIDTLFTGIFDPNSELNHVFKIMATVNKPYQVLLTTAFPAFHHRNAVNNIFMNYLGGVGPLKSFKYYKEGMRLQRKVATQGVEGLSKAEKILWDELAEYRIIRAGVFEEFTTKSGFWNRPISAIKAKALGREIPTFRREQFNLFAGRAYGTFIEENARIAHYLAKRAGGASKVEASKSVQKWLFDYRNLTVFEKQKMQPSFLFYTWMRNNLPLMIKTMITNPQVASMYNHITSYGEEEVPNWLRGGFGFKAPEVLGENKFIGSLGIGLEDLYMLNVSDAAPSGTTLGRIASGGQIARIPQRLLTRASPLLRIPAEFATQKEMFSGREWQEIPTGKLVGRLLPTSRFSKAYYNDLLLGSIKNIKEGEIPASRVVDFMTGMRLYKVRPRSVRISNLKRRMQSTGKFETFRQLKAKKKKDKYAKDMMKQLRAIIREK